MERKLKLSDRKTADRLDDTQSYRDRVDDTQDHDPQNYTSPPRGHIAVGGIYPKDRSRERTPVGYAHAIQKAGGKPVVYSTYDLVRGEEVPAGLEVQTKLDPETTTLPSDVIGLVLPGGGDIDPSLYGQEPHPRTQNVSKRRDRFETNLLKQALERDLPIFAVCRGMQLLNVHLGGTLDQHLADVEGRLEHDRDRPRAEPAHGARFAKGTLLAEVLGTESEINSHHHQGLDVVADRLKEIGWAEDGVLEAVVMPDRFWVVGVQWHPEAMAPVYHPQLAVFEKFVEATREYAASHVETRSA